MREIRAQGVSFLAEDLFLTPDFFGASCKSIWTPKHNPRPRHVPAVTLYKDSQRFNPTQHSNKGKYTNQVNFSTQLINHFFLFAKIFVKTEANS